ncbi:MAG: hypothetical protein LIP01_05500 [Tannerellaceae bacterium]|nr:hypothetical protein [Tannerellaceae bacterium]
MKSIFQTIQFPGKPVDLIGAVQIMFDEASAQQKVMFEKTFIDEWFTMLPPQYNLTVQALIGKYNIRFMASIIGDKSGTPLRPTQGFEQFFGTIPRIGHKFPLDADTIRTYMAMLENSRLKPDVKVDQFRNLLMENVQNAYLGCKDAVSSIVLQSLSNFGVARFNELNNPDGRAYEVDYRMPEDNKVISPIDFTEENIDDVDVLAFLHKLHYYYLNKGITFGELLMSPDMLYFILSTPKLRRIVHGKDKSDDIVSEERLNQELKKRVFLRCVLLES